MTDQEVPANQSSVNRLARKWLAQTKAPISPQQPYVIQLAIWGLEEEGITTPDPLAPSQPTPEAVKQQAYSLLQSGPKPAQQAMQVLLGNPNLSMEDQYNNLERVLLQAKTPAKAADQVVEVIYDLMVATAP